jgi:hypothetical protein
MAKVRIDAGVCGFITEVTAESDDGQNVRLAFSSTCPHVMKAAEQLESVDAYVEIFTKPAQTQTYAALSEHLPHAACPVYAGVLKAIEAAAGLALPRPASITFVDE